MDKDYKAFSFPLPDSTKNFVKIVKNFCSKQKHDLSVSSHNRDKPIGTDGRTDLFYEKYLLISDTLSMPDLRYFEMEIDFFEYEFDDLASELHFIDSPRDLMLIQIIMAPEEGDRLYDELNQDLFEVVNPVDYATSIFVNLAAIGTGSWLLPPLFRHLFAKYDGLEEIIKPQIERNISQSEIFEQALEQIYGDERVQSSIKAFSQDFSPPPQYDDQGVITVATLKAYFPNDNEKRLKELLLTQKLWDVQRLTHFQIDSRDDIALSTFKRRKKMLMEKGLLKRRN